MTTSAAAQASGPRAVEAMLDVLFIRSSQLADRAALGVLPFLEAVDMSYSVAEWSGLVDLVGADVVQRVLADAFIGVPR